MRRPWSGALVSLAIVSTGLAFPQKPNVPPAKPQEVKWSFRAPMPGELYAHAAAVVGDKIHVVGGRGEKSGFNGYHYVYDISTNRWDTRASMPSGSSNLAAAAFGGKVYVFGGNEQPEKALVYDPATDRWRSLATVPTPRQHINYSAVEAAGRIYLIGGVEKRMTNGQWAFTVTNRNEIFDPLGNTWSDGPPLSDATQMPAAAFVDGKIYVIGGSDAGFVYHGNVEAYDVARKTWEKRTRLPEACYPAGIAVVRKGIFVISGLRRESAASRLYAYAPESDTWAHVSDVPVNLRQGQMVSYGNRLFVVGGTTNEATHSSCIEGEVMAGR